MANHLDVTDLMAELEELKVLVRGVIQEFPVASGLWTDSDGQDGYGYLKALRLFLRDADVRDALSQSSGIRNTETGNPNG